MLFKINIIDKYVKFISWFNIQKVNNLTLQQNPQKKLVV